MYGDGRPQSGLGAQVRAARLQRGLTLRELGTLCGISAAALSQLESGRTVPSRERLTRIGAELSVELVHPRDALHHPPGFTHWREYGPMELHPVLAAALASFVEIGYHGSTMRMIADRCGLSTPTLYYHYASKQAILAELLELGMQDLLARSTAARDDGADPLDRFCLLIESIVLYHARRQALAFVGATEVRALTSEHRKHHVAQRDQQQLMVSEQLAAAVRSRQATVADPSAAARAVVTMCTAVANWYHPHRPKSPPQIAAEYVELSRRLVGADRRPGRGRA